MAKFHLNRHKTFLILRSFHQPKINNMSKITKTINICFCLALASLFACQEAPKNSAPTDKVAITDVVQNFYKWYPPAGIERIEGFLAVEGDEEDVVFVGEEEIFVGHGVVMILGGKIGRNRE